MKALLSNNSILKNGLWLYLLQIFNTVIPLITLPYVTRILGSAGYGTFSIALNIVAYLQVLIEYGFAMSATRELAISNKETKFISKVFSSIVVARAFLYVIAFIIMISYLLFLKANAVLWNSMLVMMICSIGYCFQLNWLFQGMQEMKFISIANILARTVSTILIFLCVQSYNDIVLYSFLYSISPFLSSMIGLIIASKRYSIRLTKIRGFEVLDQLKKGWYVFTTQISAKVFGAIGITFLGLFSSDAIVGTFAAIQKIPNLMILTWVPISQVLYPLVSQKMEEGFNDGSLFLKKYKIRITIVAVLLALVISVFSKSIVGLAFGSEYVSNYYWVIPLMMWVVLSIYNNFLGVQTLLAAGYDKEYSVCFQIGVIATIFINWLLIYLYGGNGAAVAPMISEFILMLSLSITIKRIKDSNN